MSLAEELKGLVRETDRATEKLLSLGRADGNYHTRFHDEAWDVFNEAQKTLDAWLTDNIPAILAALEAQEEPRKGERRIDHTWISGKPLRREQERGDRRKVAGTKVDRKVGSAFTEQIAAAKAEVATWTPERRAGVQLEGSNYDQAQEPRKGERRAARDVAGIDTWPGYTGQLRRDAVSDRRKIVGTKDQRGAKHRITENAGESSTVQAEVASAAPHPLADRIDALLSNQLCVVSPVSWIKSAKTLLREAAKELRK